jgi:hypothetical protein
MDLLDGEGEAVMAKAVEMAKAGDPVALRLVVDRIYPRGCSRPVAGIPELSKPLDLVDAIAAVIRSAARGEISLGEAQQFAGLLDVQRKVIETQDLAVRIGLLEEVRK